jgi:alpha,alpha-trehalose-phosphate synthase [UDP-forming]/trehalose-phosphatase
MPGRERLQFASEQTKVEAMGTNKRRSAEDLAWDSELRHTPLAVVTDLDGTLIPFATRPEDAAPAVRALVDELATLPGVTVAVVSGRPRDTLDAIFPAPRSALLVAEHGAWRAEGAGWTSTVNVDSHGLDALAEDLRSVIATCPEALLERKTWGLAFHYRLVPRARRASALVQLRAAVEPWLAANQDFEPLFGAEVLEVRVRSARKSSAVAWVREVAGEGARLLILGDDTTNEDMFEAARGGDVTLLVSADPDRTTRARWRLESAQAAQDFLRGLIAVRRDSEPVSTQPVPITRRAGPRHRLVMVSNRLPDMRGADAGSSPRTRNVGGLVSALRPVLEARDGVWLGWSGQTSSGPTESEPRVERAAGLALASVDFPDEWHRRYYNGFANSALWPLFHSFPARAKIAHADWHAFVRANAAFATIAGRLAAPGGTVWAHDYHLLLLAKFLRAGSYDGKIGFFQHIPFPGPDIFFLLPWADEILDAMLDFDLIGFHTHSHEENFLHCVSKLADVRVEGGHVVSRRRRARVGAYPLGIIPDEFQEPSLSEGDEIDAFLASMGSIRLVLGVDRLDYTKGIPERIDAFGRLLGLFPEWRRNVCLVQISVPSRADVPEYVEQRSRVETIVGRVNGEFGEADWVPIRYLYRSYGRSELSRLYRVANVGYVTPLRDGMNLVAKEFVAAQDPQAPGVLLLSRFAGAAEELRAALLTNPWDPEGTAHDLDRALRMPIDERRARHAELSAVVSKTTALTWAEDFLRDLGGARR